MSRLILTFPVWERVSNSKVRPGVYGTEVNITQTVGYKCLLTLGYL